MAYLRTIGRSNKPRRPTGTVKWFNEAKGFGFIVPDDGSADVFVHVSAVQRSGITTLQDGQRLEYDLVTTRDGRNSAQNLRLKSESLLNFPMEPNGEEGALQQR